MKLILARLLLRVLSWLPLSVIRGLGPVIGWVVWRWPGRTFGRSKQKILRQINVAFPDLTPHEQQQLLRRNLTAMLITALEMGPVWSRSSQWLESNIQLDAGHALDEAIRSAQGVLIVSAHLGNWEAGALYVSHRYPLVYLYKPPKSKQVHELLIERRARFGGRFVAAGSAAMRSMIRQLRQGGTAGLMFDQLPKSGEGVDGLFFNQPVETMTLAHQLAKRTACRVFFAECTRQAGQRGWIVRMRELPGLAELEPAAAATVLNQTLERRIIEQPEQYLWQYERFKSSFE
ncbi:MAG: hypothetical protein AAGH65_02800 [Pseudomonadota bacterium]